jgi:hypothetical protein
MITHAYWGDLAATFAWQRLSRPSTPLLKHGAGSSEVERPGMRAMSAVTTRALDTDIVVDAAPPQPDTGFTSGRKSASSRGSTASDAAANRASSMTPDELADLMAAVCWDVGSEDTAFVIAADLVAHDPTTQVRLRAEPDLESELVLLRVLWQERYQELVAPGLKAQGSVRQFFGRASDRLGEAMKRGVSLPGYVLSRAIAEFREPLNDAATLFIGDVLYYMKQQGTREAPGPIQRKLLQTLALARENQMERGNEPLILLSHSMGGQIVYDVLTSHLPAMEEYRGIRVDFWCATASQVGLFEELKLFLASDPRYGRKENERVVPLPSRDHLGTWWNVWDHNDFISYSVAGIIAGVRDTAYDSGMSLATAHSGYLRRPSFYRRLRTEIVAARNSGWRRSE